MVPTVLNQKYFVVTIIIIKICDYDKTEIHLFSSRKNRLKHAGYGVNIIQIVVNFLLDASCLYLPKTFFNGSLRPLLYKQLGKKLQKNFHNDIILPLTR